MSIHNTIQKRRLAVITYQFDTATEDVMDYAGTNSITPPKPSRVIALDQLIKGLKRFNIWAKLDVLSNFAYNDTNADKFALIDLVRVSEMTAFGGMSYTAEGYEGNGVDGYIDTEYNPATDGVNYLLDDAAKLAVVYSVSGDYVIQGIASESFVNDFGIRTSVGHRINSNSNNLSSSFNFSGIGTKAMIRTNASDVLVVNNSTEASLTQDSSSTNFSNNMTLLRRRVGYGGNGLSFWLNSSSLTYSETQTFRALYNAYLKQIGLTQFA